MDIRPHSEDKRFWTGRTRREPSHSPCPGGVEWDRGGKSCTRFQCAASSGGGAIPWHAHCSLTWTRTSHSTPKTFHQSQFSSVMFSCYGLHHLNVHRKVIGTW